MHPSTVSCVFQIKMLTVPIFETHETVLRFLVICEGGCLLQSARFRFTAFLLRKLPAQAFVEASRILWDIRVPAKIV